MGGHWCLVSGLYNPIEACGTYLINDMSDPVRNDQIGRHNVNAVDEIFPTLDGYADIRACSRFIRTSIDQERLISRKTVDDVIGQ